MINKLPFKRIRTEVAQRVHPAILSVTLVIAATLFVSNTSALANAPASSVATDWTSYDTITIKHENIDESLTDFPAYVDLADLSANFWSITPSEPLLVGTDIRVTIDDATPQELPRELVAASSSAETRRASLQS